MLTQKIAIKTFVTPFLIGVTAVLMASCGTQNKVYNQNDGIYASGERTTQEEIASNKADEFERSNYYKQYFESKTKIYDNVADEEDVIFTDIEAYSTTETMDNYGNIVIEDNYEDGYGSWGSNSEQVTVNIYNN